MILKLVTNSLTNENNDVKILTLEKILSLLKWNHDKLQGLVLSNEETDPFITSLIVHLLECSRSTEHRVASLAGMYDFHIFAEYIVKSHMDKKIEKLIIFQLPFIIRRMPWNNWGRGSWTTSFGRRLEPRHQQDLLICFGGGFYR